jgi:UDP-N-acetylmuramate: L-alanyl-gamma-D-glutamyl-meso-diaminopimelate ligase
VNNLEFDHADIFPDLASIQRQFHHLLRMVPAEGLVLYPNEDSAVQQVIQMGCWSEQQTIGKDWQLGEQAADGSQFEVMLNQHRVAHVSWDLGGQHNMHNGLMAIAAARHVGVTPDIAAKALTQFKNVKRRMELRGSMGGIHLYDDFAHHPTAIRTTLAGLRAKVADKPIIAIMELRSHTMKMGVHQRQLAQALEQADQLYVYHGIELEWDVEQIVEARGHKGRVFSDLSAMQQAILTEVKPGDNLLVMSNGGFGGLIDKLLAGLKAKYGKT